MNGFHVGKYESRPEAVFDPDQPSFTADAFAVFAAHQIIYLLAVALFDSCWAEPSERTMPNSKHSVGHSSYASILVQMGLDNDCEARAKLATNLADRFKSRLIGIASLPVLAPLYFENAAEGVASIIEIEERRA